jgi:hypothetical protein
MQVIDSHLQEASVFTRDREAKRPMKVVAILSVSLCASLWPVLAVESLALRCSRIFMLANPVFREQRQRGVTVGGRIASGLPTIRPGRCFLFPPNAT